MKKRHIDDGEDTRVLLFVTLPHQVLLCGFGIGLACSLIYLKLDSNIPLEVVENDARYSY